jgi:hypothetical protein
MDQSQATHITNLISLAWNSSTSSLDLSASYLIAVVAAIMVAVAILWRWLTGGWTLRSFEIDQAEIGVGNNKFRFKPNLADRQVAYAIWVELSTRKIGLEIDFEHDVLAEIYDSWYNYFTVTRDLIKGIPVAQVKRDSTQTIIKLSIEVLNQGLRPHLTKWKKYDQGGGAEVLDPQQIQRRFPRYDELKADMERVNRGLIRYRSKMRELVLKAD